MTRCGYIAPSETPPSLLDIKKALLTYDKVLLPDPGDRELIPPQSFGSVIGMPFVGFSAGPVRPLGKIHNYDENFEKIIHHLSPAIFDEAVEIRSTYDLSTGKNFTIGMVETGGYPLNPEFMFWAYRNLVRDQDVLRSAIYNDTELLGLSEDALSELAIGNCSADAKINDDPAPPSIDGNFIREGTRDSLTIIARSRAASAMKTIGYCAAKDLVPILSSSNSRAIVHKISSRASNIVDQISAEDPYWAYRQRALEIAHEEYIDEVVLDRMDVKDVLKLRTQAWGNHAKKRDELLRSVADLSREFINHSDFESEIRKSISEYRSLSSDIKNERSSLSFRLRCELIKIGSGGLASAFTGSALAGSISQVQTAMGAAATLLAGCAFLTNKVQEIKPASDLLKQAESQFKDNVCFGLHDFYREVGKAVGSDVDS